MKTYEELRGAPGGRVAAYVDSAGRCILEGSEGSNGRSAYGGSSCWWYLYDGHAYLGQVGSFLAALAFVMEEETICDNCNDTGWWWDGTGELNEYGDEIETLETPCWSCEKDGNQVSCSLCGGAAQLMGTLGKRQHYRCRQCGAEQSNAP